MKSSTRSMSCPHHNSRARCRKCLTAALNEAPRREPRWTHVPLEPLKATADCFRMEAIVETSGPDATGFVTETADFDRFIPDDVGCTVRSLEYRGRMLDPQAIDSRALGALPCGKDKPAGRGARIKK